MKQRAISSLPIFTEPSPALASLIDHSVTAATLAQRIEHQQPFTLLRFGDGEWLSMLGAEGYNCDRHLFLPQTMGRELRMVLDESAAESTTRANLWIGTTCELAQEGGVLARKPSVAPNVTVG